MNENIVTSQLDEITDKLHNVQVYYLRTAETLVHDYCLGYGLNKTPYELQLALDLMGKIDDDIEFLISALEERKILAGS